jgi:hypothetical protein
MAKYNTFVVIGCRRNNTILITSSARKATGELFKGRRIEVWSENERIGKVYAHKREAMKTYIESEREYIRMKQTSAEVRNAHRKIMRT